MSSAVIRPCTPGDLEALRHISIETYEQTFRGMTSRETMDAYLGEAFAREKLEKELAAEGCHFFFQECGMELSGYLKLNEAPDQSDLNDPRSLEIERIYVRAPFQGRGLGKTLMDFALRTALASRKDYVWLGVWEKNSAALAFYSKMGFAVAGTHSFRMGEELQSDLIMKRLLSG